MENPGIRKKRRIVKRDWLSLMVLNCHTLTRNKYDQKFRQEGEYGDRRGLVQLLALTSASASRPLRRRPTYHSLLTYTSQFSSQTACTTQVENLLPIYILQVSSMTKLCATCVCRCNENTLLHVRYSRQDVQLSILPVYHLRLNQTACNDFHQQTKYEYIE